MKPSSSLHSRGRESVTFTARPLSVPRPVVIEPFQPLHSSDFSRSLEPSLRRTTPDGCSAPRLQLTIARMWRSIGRGTETVRVHGPGSVHEAVTVNGAWLSPTLNGW